MNMVNEIPAKMTSEEHRTMVPENIITNLQADLTSFQEIANGLKELGSTESTIMEIRS